MTRNSIKLGVAAIATLFGGALLVQGAADAPAFAQATAGQAPTGTTGQPTTTDGTNGTAQQRISRPRTNAPRGRNVGPGEVGPGGGQVGPGGQGVPITVSECVAVGGVIDGNSSCGGQPACRVTREGTRNGLPATFVTTLCLTPDPPPPPPPR
jgi:hypothetical protein